jgi:hypothetical protein
MTHAELVVVDELYPSEPMYAGEISEWKTASRNGGSSTDAEDIADHIQRMVGGLAQGGLNPRWRSLFFCQTHQKCHPFAIRIPSRSLPTIWRCNRLQRLDTKMAPNHIAGQVGCRCGLGAHSRDDANVYIFTKHMLAQPTSFFSSVAERGIAAMQVILRSLFRSREGAVLLIIFCPSCAYQCSWFCLPVQHRIHLERIRCLSSKQAMAGFQNSHPFAIVVLRMF